MPNSVQNIAQRKKDHLDLCLNKDVKFSSKSNGFEKYDFLHSALPEIDYELISTKSLFLGQEIGMPFLISSMTGGIDDAGDINLQLGEIASQFNIPIGVGSQRAAFENKDLSASFKVLKNKSLNIPVLANIGAVQIVSKLSNDDVKSLIDMINAQALIIHLNPAQELFQTEGETNFSYVLKNIESLCSSISLPIIVKEVGHGISKKVAKQLLNAGVKGIDVAGAGGTSWSKVEMLRSNDEIDTDFVDWGLPTSYCIKKCAKLKKKYDFLLIGSGGITNGFDMAKAIALGADIAASARILLEELNKNGQLGVERLLGNWKKKLQMCMFLTGAKNVNEFQDNKIKKVEELY